MSLVTSISAQNYDELAQQLANKRQEIKQVEAQLAETKNQEKTLNSQLKFIDAQNKLTQLKIEEAEFQLKKLDKEIVIMHPGPINRGVEITSDVADSKQSIILDQVENGVAIRMAVLYLLAGQTQ